MNSILLFLSDHKDNRGNNIEMNQYTYENGKKYFGIQTNDAPMRCLFDLAAEDDKGTKNNNHPWIDQILVICSDQVLNIRTGKSNKTSFEYFEDMVHDLQREYGYGEDHKVSIQKINYDKDQNESPDEKAARIYQEISECLNHEGDALPDEQNIYIDYTGGFRDISFLMTTIVRYLEVAGIRCRKIIYSDFHTHEIKNINYIYKMFQQINAVNAFLATGNAEELRTLYRDSSDEVKNIISAIQKVSDTVLMCDVGHIDEALDALNRAIPENLEQDDLSSALFNSLLPVIKKKMHLTGSRMEYPDLISWCLDNRMVQQAVTFYVEKMPVYYFDRHLLPSNITRDTVLNNGSRSSTSREAEIFYTELYRDPTPAEKQNDPVDQLKKVLDVFDHISPYSHSLLSEVLKKISCQKKRKPEFNSALERIRKDITECYSIKGIPLPNASHERFNPLPKDVIKFLNAAKNNDKYLKDCLYGKYPDKDAEKVRTTYRNKVETLKKLSDGKIRFNDHNEVLKKMEYYLAVKIIRNHMNHAAGGESNKVDPTEPEAISYLNEKANIHFDAVNPTIDQVITILRNGISLDQEIMK